MASAPMDGTTTRKADSCVNGLKTAEGEEPEVDDEEAYVNAASRSGIIQLRSRRRSGHSHRRVLNWTLQTTERKQSQMRSPIDEEDNDDQAEPQRSA
jgi:hypothetical protein